MESTKTKIENVNNLSFFFFFLVKSHSVVKGEGSYLPEGQEWKGLRFLTGFKDYSLDSVCPQNDNNVTTSECCWSS